MTRNRFALSLLALVLLCAPSWGQMLKNVSGQKIGAQLVSATDGSAVTSGTTTVYVTIDAGTQAQGTVGSGAATHEGNGYWTYAPSQAESNGDLLAFTFVNTSAVPATVQTTTRRVQTWYVAASGGDNGNTGHDRSAPLATFAEAQTRASAGDIIRLIDGSYSGAITISKPITLEGDSRAGVTITHTNTVIAISADHVTVRNLTVTNTTANYGISFPSRKYVRLENVAATGFDDGVFAQASEDAEINHCVISGAYDGMNCASALRLVSRHSRFVSTGTYPTSPIAYSGVFASLSGAHFENCEFATSKAANNSTNVSCVRTASSAFDPTTGLLTLDNCEFRATASHASQTGGVYGIHLFGGGGGNQVVVKGGVMRLSNANGAADIKDVKADVDPDDRVRLVGTICDPSRFVGDVQLVDKDIADTLADTADMQPKIDVTLSTRAPESGGNIVAVKAKTDNLPADPASEGTAAAAQAAAESADTKLDTLPADIAESDWGKLIRAAVAGRMVINQSTRIMTFYDEDGTTPLATYQINPNLTRPLERVPQ
jgi:hypothetical protein